MGNKNQLCNCRGIIESNQDRLAGYCSRDSQYVIKHDAEGVTTSFQHDLQKDGDFTTKRCVVYSWISTVRPLPQIRYCCFRDCDFFSLPRYSTLPVAVL